LDPQFIEFRDHFISSCSFCDVCCDGLCIHAARKRAFEAHYAKYDAAHLLLGCRGKSEFMRLSYFVHDAAYCIAGYVRIVLTATATRTLPPASNGFMVATPSSCRYEHFFLQPVAHTLLCGLVKQFWAIVLREEAALHGVDAWIPRAGR
jgi:hypothetical protein